MKRKRSLFIRKKLNIAEGGVKKVKKINKGKQRGKARKNSEIKKSQKTLAKKNKIKKRALGIF